MTTTTTTSTYKEVKDYLTGQLSGGPGKKIPTGAAVMPWMHMMPAPKDHYNEVFPGIILGDYSIAKDIEKLQEVGITHVVNCAQGKKYNQITTDEPYFHDVNIKFHGIPALDIMTYKLAPHFTAAADFMEEALGKDPEAGESTNKIYVHCQSGVSRSATIILAYLMLKRKLPLMEAVKILRSKREILPNDGFLKQLSDLHDQLFTPN